MCHCAGQTASPAATDVDAVRAALNQILNDGHHRLASARVMSEVERIYQSLTRAGFSIDDPTCLLPVYTDLGGLTAGVELELREDVHCRALSLAARFLRIAETTLEAEEAEEQQPRRYAGCADDPPF